MARVNITIPDDVLRNARNAGLNVSRLATAALAEELDRQQKTAELDAYLADLAEQLGPVGDEEAAQAKDWVDRVLAGTRPAARARRRSRSA